MNRNTEARAERTEGQRLQREIKMEEGKRNKRKRGWEKTQKREVGVEIIKINY
jgi:hypothetical protein